MATNTDTPMRKESGKRQEDSAKTKEETWLGKEFLSLV